VNNVRIGGWNPTVVNRNWARPNIGVATNRVTNVNVNRTTINPIRMGGRGVTAYSSRNIVNMARLYNRPWGHRYPWYHGGWRGWNYWPSFWGGWGAGYGTGFALGEMSDIGYVGPTIVYDNPYYVPVPVGVPVAPVVIQESNTYVVPPALDYSRPIQVPSAQQVNQTDSDLATQSKQQMDLAVAAFKGGDYATAMRECDQAIELLPGDTNLHEFRALCQFARKKYKDAAGTLYAVLAAGPGWDWATLSSFYPNEEAYTRQLRALEGFARANPKDASAHFVLAYQYLVLNQPAAAIDQLAEVVKLQPNDKVSSGLLDALRKGQSK
jgi:tetratricopeptide (TPR) repeat protein